MSTQTTTAKMGLLSDSKPEGIRIPDALKLAIMRKIQRLAAMNDEPQAHNWAHFVRPSELYLLEAEGFMVDFDTGLAVDTLAEVRS